MNARLLEIVLMTLVITLLSIFAMRCVTKFCVSQFEDVQTKLLQAQP